MPGDAIDLDQRLSGRFFRERKFETRKANWDKPTAVAINLNSAFAGI